jgi:hypothetical protein
MLLSAGVNFFKCPCSIQPVQWPFGIICSNSILSATLTRFTSRWNASAQIPERTVKSALIGFYGAIDKKEGGHTARQNAPVSEIHFTPGTLFCSRSLRLIFFSAIDLFFKFRVPLQDHLRHYKDTYLISCVLMPADRILLFLSLYDPLNALVQPA